VFESWPEDALYLTEAWTVLLSISRQIHKYCLKMSWS